MTKTLNQKIKELKDNKSPPKFISKKNCICAKGDTQLTNKEIECSHIYCGICIEKGRKEMKAEIIEVINKWWAKNNCHTPEDLIKQIKEQKQ